MAKVLGLKQLRAKKHMTLENLPVKALESFGALVMNFIMIIWGQSGNGKSSFNMQFIKWLVHYGKVLYLGLEEGFEASMQQNVDRHLSEEEHSGKIEFADHEMTIDELRIKLRKKKSPRFIFIDSLQYWNITYIDYKSLKEEFPRKSFIFISHAKGKSPDGKTAEKIMYDAGLKVRVEGYVAFIISRYGSNKPFVIWEEGARKYWGDKYRSVVEGIPDKKAPRKKKAKKKTENELVQVPNDVEATNVEAEVI